MGDYPCGEGRRESHLEYSLSRSLGDSRTRQTKEHRLVAPRRDSTGRGRLSSERHHRSCRANRCCRANAIQVVRRTVRLCVRQPATAATAHPLQRRIGIVEAPTECLTIHPPAVESIHREVCVVDLQPQGKRPGHPGRFHCCESHVTYGCRGIPYRTCRARPKRCSRPWRLSCRWPTRCRRWSSNTSR